MRRLGGSSDLVLATVLLLALASPAHAEGIRSIEQFLANDGDLPFADARNRIAMFTFEDPDDTGLGDTIAFLASKRVLFDAQVDSLAIILFEQGLAPDESGLSYFEKVDRLTADRGFIAALWGHIARDGDELVVDTFVQLHPEPFEYRFHVRGLTDSLRATLPGRIWVQSFRLPISEVEAIHAIAESVRTLREGPTLDAPPVSEGYLVEGTTYRVVNRDGNWRELALIESNVIGWTSIDAQCGEDRQCAGVIAGASFLNDLLRYANGQASEFRAAEAYTPTSRAVGAQVEVLELLKAGRDDPGRLEQAIETTSEWATRRDVPGSAAFANLRAVARLYTLELTGELGPETVRQVANELAPMAVEDPGNLDLLHNLWLLFEFIGDDDKSRLAIKLYEEQSARVSN